VNNAGVAVGGMVGEISMEDWQWIMGINLWGVIYGCHVFVPRMKAAGRGHVLNVASAAGLIAPGGMAPYNVTKAGVVALSETLAGELGGSGVGVSVLCPTFFQTNIAEAGRGSDERMKKIARKLMAQSKLQAADVARMALDAADRGDLYVLPMSDGRWMWRIKRANPQRFHRMAPKLLERMVKSLERRG
jgi:short-subunit dehydrogenase